MNNLLTDPLFRTNLPEALSLPALFAALMRDEVSHYPSLRPHQDAPWHMFLAQLGALALHRAGCVEPPTDEGSWREVIRALTPGFDNDEPWCLIGNDRSKPAFMQPPEPEGVIVKYQVGETPDSLDMLITAKNHDLKQSVAKNSGIDDWIFALVTLQTAEGFNGSGNYGIVRMNGGSSSRVTLSLVPINNPEVMSVSPGRRLLWDVRKLMQGRAELLKQYEMYPDEDGLSLLWILPWQEGRGVEMNQLDPWFIEICRRVRLLEVDGRVMVQTGTSKGERIAGKQFNGVTGDPWAPVKIDKASLTLGERDFSYRLVNDLLFSADWNLPPMLDLTKEEKKSNIDWLLMAQAIGRGNSKTYGYRERRLLLPRKFASILSSRDHRAAIGNISKAQIDEIKKFKKIVGAAIASFVEGGSGEKASNDDFALTNSYQDRLDKAADALFFPALWKRCDAEQGKDCDRQEKERLAFLHELLTVSKQLLEEALGSLPCPAIYRHRAHVKAKAKFDSMIHSEKFGFPVLRNQLKKEEDQQDDAA